MKIHPKTYFDSAATTPVDDRVLSAMREAESYWGNENSKHHHGFASWKMIRKSLETIADILGCNPDQLAVTYSGTDANRRVIWAVAKRIGLENCYCSAVEHSSILDEIGTERRFDPSLLTCQLASSQSLMALMGANSETGRIYDGSEIRQKFPDSLILRDYAQSVGKGLMPDLQNADFGTFSPQKIYGPKMVGLLYMRDPQNFQDLSKDSHTKSVPLVVGMAKAFEIWAEERESNASQLKQWDDQIRSFITERIPDHKFHESNAERVPGLINVAFAGLRGGELMTTLSSEEQIAVSIGSACTADIMSPTEVIKFIESDEQWRYPIRIGLHKYLDDGAVEEFCEVLEHYVGELRK